MFGRVWSLGKETVKGYNGDYCSQHAAAISYHVIFSLVPLAIFIVSVLGLVLQDESTRQDLIDRVLDIIPLSEGEGRQTVEDAIIGFTNVSGPALAISLLIMLWSASAIFSSIRRALNAVWGKYEVRPFVWAKLTDFAQIGVLSLALLASLVLTGVLRAVREVSYEWGGPFASSNLLWELVALALPVIPTFTVFLVLYHIVPASRPHWNVVAPGALLATLLFEVLKNTFAIYVTHFNDFDVVYGSLAGVLLFLLYMYLAASILLLGAELSRAYALIDQGTLATEAATDRTRRSLPQQALRMVKGLFVRQP